MSAAGVSALPRYDKIFLVGIWLETVVWATNIAIFFSAIWIIFWKRGGSTQWMLGITSTVLFVFATIHVSASLRQLLEAFVDVPEDAPPLYSSLYFVNEAAPMAILKHVIYDTTVWLQDIVLIWRLYVVWERSWKICFIPFVVDLAHMAAAYAATIIISRPNVSLYDPVLKGFGLAGWALDLAVNVSVTAVISVRLWYMGMKVTTLTTGGAHATSSPNRFTVPIFTIIESGALFATVTIVMMIMYCRGSPLTLAAMDIATQLAVTTPLLIIVRVGLGLTHGLPSAYKNVMRGTMSTFRAPSMSGDAEYSLNTVHISRTRVVTESDDAAPNRMVYVMKALEHPGEFADDTSQVSA